MVCDNSRFRLGSFWKFIPYSFSNPSMKHLSWRLRKTCVDDVPYQGMLERVDYIWWDSTPE
jgi:hypothetical protein